MRRLWPLILLLAGAGATPKIPHRQIVNCEIAAGAQYDCTAALKPLLAGGWRIESIASINVTGTPLYIFRMVQ